MRTTPVRGLRTGVRRVQLKTKPGPKPQTRVGHYAARYCQADGCEAAVEAKMPFCGPHWLQLTPSSQRKLLATGSVHLLRQSPEFYQAIECGLADLRKSPCVCGHPHT